MENDIIKHFVNKDVEILVAGTWIEGHMTPIVKGVVTLLPLKDAAEFYGPTACNVEVIQAIRQVKKATTTANPPVTPPQGPVRSSFDQVPHNLSGARFVSK